MSTDAADRPAATIWELGLPAPPANVADRQTVEHLAADARARANDMLNGVVFETDPLMDLLRLLHNGAMPPDGPSAVATRAGITTAELARLRIAYRIAGAHGARAAAYAATPDVDVMERATDAIGASRGPALTALTIDGNRITDADIQIRLGPDDRWYPFLAAGQDAWTLTADAAADPRVAYAVARKKKHQRAPAYGSL